MTYEIHHDAGGYTLRFYIDPVSSSGHWDAPLARALADGGLLPLDSLSKMSTHHYIYDRTYNGGQLRFTARTGDFPSPDLMVEVREALQTLVTRTLNYVLDHEHTHAAIAKARS